MRRVPRDTHHGGQREEQSLLNYLDAGGGAQTAPVAKTTTVALTAAEMMDGLITGNSSSDITLTTPAASAIETEWAARLAKAGGGPNIGDSFDFAIINIQAGATGNVTLAGGSNVTIIGRNGMACLQLTTGASMIGGSSGLFRCRKATATTMVIYRLGG